MLVIFGGCGLLGYIIAWIIMPEEPVAQLSHAPTLQVSPQAAPTQQVD
jgi:hypothetical protein